MSVKDIDLDRMVELRGVSLNLASHLNLRLQSHLETLSPLFAPRKVLGEYMQSAFADNVPGADANFAALEADFKRLAKDVFKIPSKLGAPIANIKNQLTAVPWEYSYRLNGRTVTITSPVRWVIAYTYTSGYSLSDFIADRAQDNEADPENIRSLVLRSLTLKKLLDDAPGIGAIFSDLRFPLTIETAQHAGDLPFVVAGCDVPVFRPQDEAIEKVLAMSGKPVFEELIDVDELRSIRDPFLRDLTSIVSTI